MALVNHAKREINAKIVCCGPSGAGKGSLIKAICSRLPAETRGQLRSMSFQQDRMLFFDFTHPEGGDSGRYSLRLHLYTLTGDITQDNAWKMVLKGVDGVAFVADPDPTRQIANQQAFDQMKGALAANGKSLDELPAVVICTKQDMPDIVPTERIGASLQAAGLTLFPVEALSGTSVLDPLCELLTGIVANLEQLGLALHPGVRGLCNLVPPKVVPQSLPVEAKRQPSVPPVCDLSAGPGDEMPLIAFDDPPELSPDGSLTIRIRVSCCGRSSKSALRISLHNGI